METKGLDQVLVEHPFFKDMKPDHLQIVAGCAANVRFDPNVYVLKEGEQADSFYIVRFGKVALELHEPRKGMITIETLEDGDVFGWSWLFPPYQAHFNVRAMTLVRAISLDGKCLRGKIEKDHDLGYDLINRFAQVMISRLEATRAQLLDLYQ